MVITLHTKLVTRATEVKRKQACKTDYTVKSKVMRTQRKKRRVNKCPGGVGDPRAHSGGNELSSGDATGGAVCSEESAGQEEAGSESDPASGSMTEWKTREGGYLSGRQEDLPAWSRAVGSFHQKPHTVFSHRNPSCPLTNRRGMLEFQPLPSGRLPTWAPAGLTVGLGVGGSVLPLMCSCGEASHGKVTGRAQAR